MSTEKYLIDGRAVEVIEVLKSGYLVCDIYQDGKDSDKYFIDEEPHLVQKVFDHPPIAKKSDELSKLESRIEQAKDKFAEINATITAIAEQERLTIEKFRKFKQLSHLNDYLDGKTTHFAVLDNYRPEIKSFAEFADRDDYYHDKGVKLLTLFGNSKGNLQWKINTYRDGSGSWTEVVPCLSYDDARAALQAHIELQVSEDRISESLLEAVFEYKLIVPAEALEKWKERKRKNLFDAISQQEKELEKLRAKYNNI